VNKTKRTAIFERLRAANPAPTTELAYGSPFQLLIAVILSAQATDKGVNKATARLFPIAGTPEAMLQLGEEGLKEQIRTLGLFNSKALNILATCRILVERHGGEVPRTRADLDALPGVGRKTANVVLTPPSASRPWPWILTSFALPTAPASPPARPRWRWSKGSSSGSPRPSSTMPTTG